MPTRPKNSWTIVVCLLLAVVTAVIFWPVNSYEFVNYDDPDYAYENPMLQHGVTSEGIVWAFEKTFSSNWHPLTWISHMIDWDLFGARAGGHHLTNLLFHVANTLLLFLLFKKMTGALWRSALVAALFAFHPMRVESVAWVSERKDVLSGFFFLLTIWAYTRYAEAQSPKSKVQSPKSPDNTRRSSHAHYFLALFFFALGLMCKPMLVTLPFVLLLLDFWPLKRVQSSKSKVQSPPSLAKTGGTLNCRHLLAEKIPFFALTVLSSVITWFAQKAESMERWDVLPLPQRLTNALVSYARYLCKLIWPADLSVFYSYPDSWPVWQIVGSAMLLIVITVAVIRFARTRPWLVVGWFWFLGMLVPVIGIVQVGIQSIADRYVYLPGIGLLIALVWSLPEAKAERWKLYLLTGASAVALAVCIFLSVAQLRYWKDSETLFRHALKVDPDNIVANVMLAPLMEKAGKPDEAVAKYRIALKLKPGFPQMYYNIGNVLFGQKKWAEAEENYRQALQIRPDYPEAHYNLAIVLDTRGKYAEAAEHYAAALPAMGNDPDLRLNFGMALAATGRLDEAIEQYNAALQLRPNSPEEHYVLGIALRRQKKFSEAASQLTEALRLKPNYAEARRELDALKR